MTELLFYDDAYLKQCEARVMEASDDGIVLDRTVFYPLGGGQPGDAGTLALADGSVIEIGNTRRRKEDGAVLHVPAGSSVARALQKGEQVVASIDWDRRYAHMRIHTCLHLLSAVIPAGVTGGAIRDDSGRLDFDLPGAAPDRGEVEAKLNELIAQGHAVTPRWISGDELDARPELVKTMSVAPPRGVAQVRLLDIAGVDLQACGGTHVANTSEIGPVAVTRIENKGARNRRVAIAFAEGRL
jgi:misacylated tRNA(Ala) deacylase